MGPSGRCASNELQRAHIDALRGLFLDELPQAHALIVAAAREGDIATMAASLHKLRASCGFVGAARLAASVAALQQHPGSTRYAATFDADAQATARAAHSSVEGVFRQQVVGHW